MKIQQYILFTVILVLISVFNTVYSKYNKVCRELFIEDNIAREESIVANIVSWKNNVSNLICATELFIDRSIGFNQINDFSKDAKDDLYKIDSLGSSSEINGKFNNKEGLQFDNIVINNTNEICTVPKWEPDLIEDKDSIVVYISVLIKDFNTNILRLEEEKVKLLEYIRYFNRLFKQNMNELFLPQCDRITGPDRDTLCAKKNKEVSVEKDKDTIPLIDEKLNKRTKLIEESKKGLLLMEDKKQTMESMICEYIKKYKHVENVRDAIIFYVSKLNKIWAENNIKNTRIRLNYANSKVQTII